MATTSYQGPGFLLKVSAADLTTMTTLAQCGDIKGGGLSVATTEVTNQDSTNGEKEEKPTVITNQKMNALIQDPEVKALLVKKVFEMGLDKELLEE